MSISRSVSVLPTVREQIIERSRKRNAGSDRDRAILICRAIWSRMGRPTRAKLVYELKGEGFVGRDGFEALVAFAEMTIAAAAPSSRHAHEKRDRVLAAAREIALASVPATGQASRSTVATAMKRYWTTLSPEAQAKLQGALKSAKFGGRGGGLAALIDYAAHELDKDGKLQRFEWWPGKSGAPTVRGGLPGQGKRR